MTSEDITSSHEGEPARPWAVTAVGLLLLLQALGLFCLGAIHFVLVGLPDTLLGDIVQLGAGLLLTATTSRILMCIVSAQLFVLAMLAAIGFLRLWRNAWLTAMLLQGLTLSLALILYFRSRPPFLYLLLFYGIFMVLYLAT